MFLQIFSVTFCALIIQFSATKSPVKVIIDTDPGTDDAVALLLALNAKELDIVALTCTYGNVHRRKVEENVMKILTVANHSNINEKKYIPIYSGAVKPIQKLYEESDYFGQDGLGDFLFDQNVTISIDRLSDASVAMIELSKKYSGSLNIITLGPLTNIALAIKSDPNFVQRINKFYVMGGLVYGPEDEEKVEYNFKLDPESVEIFLNSSMKQKSVIVPWDVMLKNKISKEWRENILGKLNSSAIKFLNKVERIVLTKLNAWYPIDSVTIALMVWPDLITSSTEAYVTVEMNGTLSGMINANFTLPKDTPKSVQIVQNFNVEAFKEKLLKYLG